MKIRSVIVRNYRVHRETKVDFDDSRTLIGGGNEVGKSTLIEAIHRALFMRSRVTGDAQNGMVSNIVAGHPEVEVQFEVNGKDYRVLKRFSGNNGTTQLTDSDGKTIRGEEAESQLATLLGVEEVGGGRGIASRVNQQWAHLWIWQGKAGEDPSADIGSEHSRLTQRLQEYGGAGAMQSDTDSRIANTMAALNDAIFNQNGKVKKGSDLEKAEASATAATTVVQIAEEALNRLRQAADDFEDGSESLVRATNDIGVLKQELRDVEANQTRVAALEGQKSVQQEKVNNTEDTYVRLFDAETKIKELKVFVGEAEKSLSPEKTKLDELREKVNSAKSRLATDIAAHEAIQEKMRKFSQRRDYARACVTHFEKTTRVMELEKRWERVITLRSDRTTHRENLAKLPDLNESELEDLRSLENKKATAEAAVDAMAAGIEVITANTAIRVGDQSLEQGQSQTVAEATDVTIGEGVQLRIHPGGGDSLAEALDRQSELQNELYETFNKFGISTLAEAEKIARRRRSLRDKIDHAESDLAELDPKTLEADLNKAREEMTSASGDIDRRAERFPDLSKPTDLSKANDWLREEEDALKKAEDEEAGLKGVRQAAETAKADREKEFEDQRSAVVDMEGELTGHKANLNLLIEEYGNDEPRETALAQALENKNAAESELATILRELEALQPEILQADLTRLNRSISGLEVQHREAGEKIAIARAALISDGSEDPAASLALAKARQESAQERLTSVDRKAKAIRRLNNLFTQEQQALADQFTRPLAEKVSGYLQCLLGPEAHAGVTMMENAFTGFQLVRASSGGAIPFEQLSGGAREQVAAAFRLALAEILAADHDDCLPVVFDDAFAYSDPNRVKTLQRMLDLAASRGLQIIVLSCNPSDYSGLGARAVNLASTPAVMASKEEEGSGTDADLTTNTDRDVDDHSDAIAVTDILKTEFIDTLEAAGGKAGNSSLRETLGWTENQYQAVKTRLLEEGKVITGRGRGGSVSIPDAQ